MHNKLIFFVGAALLSWATPSFAGVYSDDMGKCLVSAMTPADQTTLIQWVFSAMALHPDMSGFTKITPEQHATFDKKGAELFDRLMTVDCRKETVAAVKYEGNLAIEMSFSTLGQVAMRGLMSNPAVAQSVGNLSKYTDKSKMEAVMKEAGVAPPAPKQ